MDAKTPKRWIGGTAPHPFSVLPRSTLPEEIAGRLLALIRDRELRPGDQLPPERSLAEMMNVSRPVLREALRALSIMKVVDIRQGSGTFITSLEPRALVSHLDFAFSSDGIALVQVLDARLVLEVGNAQLAAERATPADVHALETILERLSAAIDDPDAFSDLDIAFHNTVCAAAGNFLLTQFMGVINTLGKVSRQRTGSDRAVREATLHDHRRIFEALAAHDPAAAGRAMREHLDRVQQALRAAIEQQASRSAAGSLVDAPVDADSIANGSAGATGTAAPDPRARGRAAEEARA